jgi:hypothetical protein
MVDRGGAYKVRNSKELTDTLQALMNPTYLNAASAVVGAYIEHKRGATTTTLAQVFSVLNNKHDF